ncbi:MAG: DUF4097 family beta strand repeat-containing protein [Nibricoccus sp.]
MVLTGLAIPLPAAVERTVEKSFSVATGALLKIDTVQGAIRIELSPDNQIHVLVREGMEVDDEAAADKRLKDLDLRLEQVDGTVSVKARYLRAVRWTWQSWPPVTLSFVVKVPRACNLDLVTTEGDITIGNLDGSIHARTEAGAIFTGEVKGAVQATSLRGDISVTACSGELTITAKSGNVTVGRPGGLTKISGSGGLIEVQNARGNLRVDADGADIKVGFAHPCTESAELRAAGGDIEVILDTRSICTIRANSSRFGQVKLKNFPGAIESGEAGSSHVVATLNGGGPLVKIDASGGNVRLTGRAP